MSGIAAISTDPTCYPATKRVMIAKIGRLEQYVPRFIWDLFWMTHFAQHRGPAHSGLVTVNNGDIESIDLRTHRGEFREKFEPDLVGFGGDTGMGHISDSTAQPYNVDQSRLGRFAIGFDGNLINLKQLVQEFLDFGKVLPRADDIGVLAHLIGLGTDFVEGFAKAAEKVDGTFAAAVLTGNGIYVVQSPDGHRPLVLGQKTGAVAVASESCQFQNTGFHLVRDVEPGEIIFLSKGKMEVVAKLDPVPVMYCSFCGVYNGNPASIMFGAPVSRTRRRLGGSLAERDIAEGFIPDFIIGVPDSGRFHAIGAKAAYDLALMAGRIKRTPIYSEFLIKYGARRSFTPADQKARDLEAQMKLLPLSEDLLEILQAIKGLIEAKLAESGGQKIVIHIAVYDDSIVRGTQTKNDLVPKLLSLKQWIESQYEVEIQIHFRISNPPLLSHCPFGKSVKQGERLAAVDDYGQQLTEERIATDLGAASVRYNTIEDLANAHGIPLERLCVACDQLPSS